MLGVVTWGNINKIIARVLATSVLPNPTVQSRHMQKEHQQQVLARSVLPAQWPHGLHPDGNQICVYKVRTWLMEFGLRGTKIRPCGFV